MYESEAINRGCPIFFVILFSAKYYLIYIENNDTMKVVETLAKTYMSEFKYTSKHIAKYNHQNFSVILYKNVL